MNIFEEIYDEVYTVGCFDFFHKGHTKILNYMKQRGRKIIVGVHDDKSIEQLKNLNPNEHQPIEIRLANVKTIADVVFVVPNIDPTLYIAMIHNKDKSLKQIYIRADDNIEFPGKKYIMENMNIYYFPYTKGVSSTQIRKSKKLKVKN